MCLPSSELSCRLKTAIADTATSISCLVPRWHPHCALPTRGNCRNVCMFGAEFSSSLSFPDNTTLPLEKATMIVCLAQRWRAR